jgi:fructose-1,6-bisphosphatase/inositol monophosphatase family enzyme
MNFARWPLHDTKSQEGVWLMEIGMKNDPVEELDREEERAIAAVVRARFSNGDVRGALRTMESVTSKRLRMREQQVVRRHA